jgi:hypothetical protein
MSLVAYFKVRPYAVDIWSVCRDHNRVFVGYPPYRKRRSGSPNGLRDAIWSLADEFDVARDVGDVKGRDAPRGYRSKVSFNKRLARELQPGDFALVPRPGAGVVHCAPLVGRFEFNESAEWFDDFLRLLPEDMRRDGTDYHREVCQSWKVGDWRALPFVSLPRWIGSRLLAQDAVGLVADSVGIAHDDITRLYANPIPSMVAPSTEPEEVARRLSSWLSPASFEHLCVELLQLENPAETWIHVGGSGDGGADGLGYAPDGHCVGVLQCKWKWSKPKRDPRADADLGRHRARLVLASLVHSSTVDATGFANAEFWSGLRVAELVIHHSNRLPLAMAIRAGTSSSLD